MKKVVGLLLALTLLASPALASASFQVDGDYLLAKKGGSSSGSSSNGNSGGNNGNGGGNSKSGSVSKDAPSDASGTTVESKNPSAIKDKNDSKTVKNGASANDKKDPTATKEEIKQERSRILEESKNNREVLKTRANEIRKQAEAIEGDTVEKAELLETTAVLLEEAGELDEAIDAQEDAVQEDLTNVDRYKKLAKLMEKQGNKDIKAFVNGKHPKFDVPPVIKSGRTLVPIRAISESLGGEVTWNEEEQTVTIVRDGVEVKLVLDEVKAYVNGEEIELDVPSSSINSRIVVPLRFISEAFNATVEWEEETDSVIIVDEDATDEESSEDSTNADEDTSTEDSTDNEATTDENGTTTDDETVNSDDSTTEDGATTGLDEDTTEETVQTEGTI